MADAVLDVVEKKKDFFALAIGEFNSGEKKEGGCDW